MSVDKKWLSILKASTQAFLAFVGKGHGLTKEEINFAVDLLQADIMDFTYPAQRHFVYQALEDCACVIS